MTVNKLLIVNVPPGEVEGFEVGDFTLLTDFDVETASAFGIPIAKRGEMQYIQPSVAIVGDAQQFLYTFKMQPKFFNVKGAIGRPTAASIVDLLERASRGEDISNAKVKVTTMTSIL